MLQTKKNDFQKARTFVNTIKNDNAKSDFEKNFNENYPPVLLLKTENNSCIQASFLDLDINVNHKGYMINDAEWYDKTNEFPFSLVIMEYRDSSMHTRVFMQ